MGSGHAASPLSLDGRRALVTGGGGGIGAATARRLAAGGARVGVLDARIGAAEAVAESISAGGGEAVSCRCDVGDEASLQAAVTDVARRFDGIDTVVTSAAISIPNTTEALTLELWDALIRVNLTGVFLTLRAALPHLVRSGDGRIVTLGSMASLVAAGESCAYDASKGGVLQLTKSIALEFADRGVRANCVLPGRTATELRANTRAVVSIESAAPKAPGSALVHIPMDRAADPDEIATVVAFLCSDHASYMTGAAVPVDGGYLTS